VFERVGEPGRPPLRFRCVTALSCAVAASCSGDLVVGANGRNAAPSEGSSGASSVGLGGGAGGSDVGADPSLLCGSPHESGAYQPLVLGTEWTYLVRSTSGATLPAESNSVVELLGDGLVKIRNSGDRPAFRWLRDTGTAYVWLRNLYFSPEDPETPISDQYYDPPALRFEYSMTTVGETWAREYEKIEIRISDCPTWREDQTSENLVTCPPTSIERTRISETWTVGDRTSIAVPADMFNVLCHLRTCQTAAQCSSGEYCFARGTGKVWERSNKQEELTKYCFPARR
jgi:hypothetical protein